MHSSDQLAEWHRRITIHSVSRYAYTNYVLQMHTREAATNPSVKPNKRKHVGDVGLLVRNDILCYALLAFIDIARPYCFIWTSDVDERQLSYVRTMWLAINYKVIKYI